MTERHKKWAEKNREHLNRYQREWRARNRDKVRGYNRKWYKYAPHIARAKALRRHFGITPEDVISMLERQGGRCAICLTQTPGGKGTFHVDHDHRTGRVRGLLCRKCNIGLGCFKDDWARLQSAVSYLRISS